MRHEAEIRELLVENAIRLIGEGGFEKATTKELAHYGEQQTDFKMNESYIYRLFGSKEKLFETAFIRLDNELFGTFSDAVNQIGGMQGQTLEKMYEVFIKIWTFSLRDELRCRCYVRYYYSVYYTGLSAESHRQLFDKAVDEFRPIVKPETNPSSVIRCMFTILFDCVVRVFDGDLEDNEETRQYVFGVMYHMLKSYLKSSDTACKPALV